MKKVFPQTPFQKLFNSLPACVASGRVGVAVKNYNSSLFESLTISGTKREEEERMEFLRCLKIHRTYPIFVLLLSLLLFSIQTGCVSQYSKHLSDMRQDFYQGRTAVALQKTAERQEEAPAQEQDLLALNAAMVELSRGNPASAEQKLRTVRNHFDDIENQSLQQGAEKLLSYWTDDNRRSYEGEDYEKVLIRSFLAISNLLQQGDDAQAYSYQISQKQREIIERGAMLADTKDGENTKNGTQENPKLAYKQVALGAYLEGLLWESTWLNQSDAARAYQKVVDWAPDFAEGGESLRRAQTSVPAKSGNGVVYVFALVGRGPYKVQERAEATSTALLIADRIFSAVNQYSVPPTVAPVLIPAIRCEACPVQSVQIRADGQHIASTETILDVNRMATEQFAAIRDQVIARAVIRRIVKKGTLYAAKDIGNVNGWVSLAMDVGGVVWEATETADTRCWGLLPAQIQVARLELPEGNHQLSLRSCGYGRSSDGLPYQTTVRVTAGQNAYLLANFPDQTLIGQIVVSENAQCANVPLH